VNFKINKQHKHTRKMINEELKEKIIAEAKQARERFSGSDSKFAVSLGIAAAQYSRIKNGDTERVLSQSNWISLARRLNVSLQNAPCWKTVATPVYEFITTQLAWCQKVGMSCLLCDESDIGKTYAAQAYTKGNKNVVYVDCSQVKSKQKMIRYIAKEFGVGHGGKYADVYSDLVFYVKTLEKPLVILDEAGDLQYDAFLEIKALWNATEGACGYYMMGADGLKEKIHRAINNKKVGFAEIFSRFGKKYVKVLPLGNSESQKLLQLSAAAIIKANAKPNADVNKILRQTLGEDDIPSLRRIYKAIAIEG
jgi:Uncharacterized ATPase, putative transposase